jgi:hypothetical protein
MKRKGYHEEQKQRRDELPGERREGIVTTGGDPGTKEKKNRHLSICRVELIRI